MNRLLRKPNLLDVPEKGDPFENDKLGGRKQVAESLTQILSNVQQPFTITLEAPWGWGKSTFLRMWKRFLEKEGFSVVLLNAWETDYTEDPTIPILSDLTAFIDTKDKNTAADLRKLGKRFISGTIEVSRLAKLIPVLGDVQKTVAEILQDRLDKIEDDKKELRNFKKSLSSAVKQISGSEKPLVVLVDELDRCRPTYAVLFLEKLKHLFNVPGIAFVLAIDAGQLTDTVKLIYGMPDKTLAQNYLRRFIDFRFRLPDPSIREFCNFLVESYGIGEQFNKPNLESEKERFIDVIVNLFSMVGFGLREQEQCFTEISLALLLLGPINTDDLVLVPILCVLKNDNYALYRRICLNEEWGRDFNDWIEKARDPNFYGPLQVMFRALYSRFVGDERVHATEIENLRLRLTGGHSLADIRLWDEFRKYQNYRFNPLNRVTRVLELVLEIKAPFEA